MAKSKPKKTGQCVYCEETKPLTKDHVIARCLFPRPLPEFMATVPAWEMIKMRIYLLLIVIIWTMACDEKSVAISVASNSNNIVVKEKTSVSVGPSPQNLMTQKELTSKESSIYSVLLTELVYGKEIYATPEGLLVIQQQTYFEEDAVNNLNDKFDSSLIANFKNKNAKTDTLKGRYDIYFKYAFVSAESPSPTHKEFSQEYPKALGLLSLSRIGFNNQFNQALVFVKFTGINGKVEKSFWLISFKEGEILETKEFPIILLPAKAKLIQSEYSNNLGEYFYGKRQNLDF